MPRTKKQPESAPHPVPAPVAANGPLGEILTLSEAAAYLRLSEADVLRLVNEQHLPARQLGKEWRFLKAAIQDWLRTGAPARKDFWEASVGAWKDDPHAEELLQDIYKRRGRPMMEED